MFKRKEKKTQCSCQTTLEIKDNGETNDDCPFTSIKTKEGIKVASLTRQQKNYKIWPN